MDAENTFIRSLVRGVRQKLKVPRGRIFSAGNLVSMSRVALLPFMLSLLKKPAEGKWLVLSIVLAAIIAATDALDGFIARQLNQVSELGRVFDPIADKICIGFVGVWLSTYRGLPVWIPAVIIARDVVIVIGAIVIARKTDIVMPSHQVGRVTTFVLTVTFFIYIIDWQWPQMALVWTSGALIFMSFAVYLRIGWHMLHQRTWIA
ncbi:MAG TPA: CDP-alcohol phosphatidyltransferase family protein [Firmicutes bacterium]|nr:CDP-alcohol phosphatidyltransferase family protein [Bacillota bacterium]